MPNLLLRLGWQSWYFEVVSHSVTTESAGLRSTQTRTEFIKDNQ